MFRLIGIVAAVMILFVACQATTEPEWSAAPTREMIPNRAISGEVNGELFEANAVFFQPSFGRWELVIAEGALERPTSITTEGRFVVITLPEAPQSGSVFTQAMQYGRGYFQVPKPDDPENMTSWNARNAFIVEITAWEEEAYDPDGMLFQAVGKAAGKVYVSYSGEGLEGFSNSFIAGSFDNGIIRYMGRPEKK